jgi:hypothetical protein
VVTDRMLEMFTGRAAPGRPGAAPPEEKV